MLTGTNQSWWDW